MIVYLQQKMDPIPEKQTNKNTRTQSIDNFNCLKIIKEIEFIIIILPKEKSPDLVSPGKYIKHLRKNEEHFYTFLSRK